MAIMALGLFTVMFVTGRLFPPGRETTGAGRLIEGAVTAGLGLVVALIAAATGATATEILFGGGIGFAVFLLVGGAKRR